MAVIRAKMEVKVLSDSVSAVTVFSGGAITVEDGFRVSSAQAAVFFYVGGTRRPIRAGVPEGMGTIQRP